MSVKLNFDKIYYTFFSGIRGAFHAAPREHFEDWPVSLGEIMPVAPLIFDQFIGDRPRDIVATGYSSIRSISDRVVSILRDEGFTDWPLSQCRPPPVCHRCPPSTGQDSEFFKTNSPKSAGFDAG